MTHLALPAGLRRSAGLIAIAGLLAALALSIQPAAGQSTSTLITNVSIGDRAADGSFPITFGGGTLADLGSGDALVVTVEPAALAITPILAFDNDSDDGDATQGEIATLLDAVDMPGDYNATMHGSMQIPTVKVFVPYPKEAYPDDRAELTITVTVNDSDAKMAKATKKISPPETPTFSVVGALRQDADGILRPGQSTQLTIGLQVAIAFEVNEEDNANVRLMSSTDAIADISDAPPATLRLDADSYIELKGPAAFSDGSPVLRAGVDGALQLQCEQTSEIAPNRETGSTCYVVHDHDGDDLDADGDQDENAGTDATPVVVPSIVIDSGASSDVTAFVRMTTTDSDDADGADPLWVALVTKEGTQAREADELIFADPTGTLYEASSSSYFGSYAIPVGTVEQVDRVTLTAATGDDATGTTVATGASVSLRLGILNADGQPSDVSGISSITVTTTSGTVQAGTTNMGTDLCGAASTCNIPIRGSAGDLTSAATEAPELVGAIPITLKGVTKAGTATVSATVVATAGSSQPIYRADPISATFSGGADQLTLTAAGMPRVLNRADDTDNGNPAANLDQIAFAVTATDSRGVATTTPRTVTATASGPDGKRVGAGLTIAATADCGPGKKDDNKDKDRTKCAYIVSVTAGATSALEPGTYTLTLEATGVADGEAEFGVAGPPASVEIETDMADNIRVGGTFDAMITVKDAAGELVADGTAVSVEVRARTDRNAAVLLVHPDDGMAKTANGVAKATFTVIAREISTINVTAGDFSDIEVVDTSAASAVAATAPAEGLSSQAANGFTTWRGVGSITASALLDDLADIASVQLWNGKRWVRYAVVDGQEVPGSLDFAIEDADNLWLGNG